MQEICEEVALENETRESGGIDLVFVLVWCVMIAFSVACYVGLWFVAVKIWSFFNQ